MITLQEFQQKKELFLLYLKHEKKASVYTQRSYKGDLEQCALFWHTVETQEHTESNFNSILERFASALLQADIDKSSVARKISCLNSFKKFLKKQGIIIPVSLKRPFVKPKEPTILPVQQVFYLMEFPDNNELPTKHPLRDKAIVELLYATGIRCSELVAIEMNAIDFKTQSIVIRSKNKKERVVLFGAKAAERLKAYITQERPEVQSPYERLFLNYRTTPLTVRSIQRICAMFRQCFEDKKIVTPYILRHSFATHMLNNGADLETVQELLGHKTRASTERYIHKVSSK